MDSREIAEVTGKEHRHVLNDITKMIETLMDTNYKSFSFKSAEFSADLKTGHLPFKSEYQDSMGRMQPCFKLPYRETMILVSGYSMELRSRVIDRWLELERQHRRPAPSRKELAQMILEAEEAREAAEAKVAVLAPKAELHDKYGGIPVGYLSLRDTAKHFGWNPKAFIEKLHDMGWIFRNGRGNWTPYQDKLDRGLMDFKTTLGDNGYPQEQALFTPRGMTVLAAELEKPKAKRRRKSDDGDVMPLPFG
jgi:phage regulator Rha-like protein